MSTRRGSGDEALAGYAAIRRYDSSPSLKVSRRGPEIALQAAAKQPNETQATVRQLVIVLQYYTSYSDAEIIA
jgi:hypothetical protein